MLAASRPTPPQRAVSLLLVVLLHAALLFALLRFMVVTPSTPRVSPQQLLEMIISTAKKPVPVTVPASRPKATPHRSMPGGLFSGKVPFTASPVAPPDVTGLGQSLFGCALENLNNLTPEQRAHCHAGFTRPHTDALAEPRSHVKDPARREAEMRARNTPGRVPCTSLTEVQTSLTDSTMVPIVDPVCAADGLVNGFHPLTGLDK